MAKSELNELECLLLSMISKQACNGYDIAKMVQPYWCATHQQIYRSLRYMYERGLVCCKVLQGCRIDKKFYYLTDLGEDTLQEISAKPRHSDKFNTIALHLKNQAHFSESIKNLSKKAKLVSDQIVNASANAELAELRIVLERNLDILNSEIDFAKKSMNHLSNNA